jgi:hypothetical protein
MNIFAHKQWSWAAALALSVTSLASNAGAATGATDGASTPPPGNVVAATATATDTAPVGSAPVAPSPTSFLERMPPDAFPSTPHVRGLYGGSLWSDFHGLQWPYYPKTGIGVSGYVWIDTGYEQITVNDPSVIATGAHVNTFQLQQGRFVLRVTPTWTSGNYFVQGQAELVAAKDQTQSQPFQADADDVWVRTGQWKAWDVQLGRYQGWEVYHFGLGLDLYTLERDGAKDVGGSHNPPAIYGVTNAFYRPDGLGAGAVHLYPTPWLRFEIGSQFGNNIGGQNAIAGRPVAIVDLGWLRLKGAAEYLHVQPQGDNTKAYKNQYGGGGSIQVVIDPYVEFGFNYGFGKTDAFADDGNKSDTGSNSTYSIGGFANARVVDGLLAGAGVDYTYLVDQHQFNGQGRYGDSDHWQGFVAVQYLLFKQLFIKAVGGYALANLNPTDGTQPFYNKMMSGRLRVQYLF